MKLEQIEQNYLNSFDELNTMTKGLMTMSLTELLDTTEDILIAAYKQGTQDVIYLLDDGIDEDLVDITLLHDALNRVSGGMTYINRLTLEYDDMSEKELQRLISNEWHRMYNNGASDAANKLMALYGTTIMKEWHTVGEKSINYTLQRVAQRTTKNG